MAHALRYYYENTLKDGKVIRLEIHEKDSTKPAIPIGGVVKGLDLQIQGSEADIIAPITTTLLSMTFVDAPDLPEAATHKCGDWEEFYTPDSTYWKVILLGKDAGESEFRALWGGYVTPDSYEEVLAYRGAVTIVARDNIGHMEDFIFDYEGMETLSFLQLAEAAWAKIESPMSLVWGDTWLECEGTPAPRTMLNVSAFEEKTWREVLESVLDSYGAILRYVGNNEVRICSLRGMAADMPVLGAPLFVSGATRMLTPAVKKIEETAEYELETDLPAKLIKEGDFAGNTGTYKCKIEGENFGTLEHDAPVWPIGISSAISVGWIDYGTSYSLYFNPYAYELGYFSQYRDLGEDIYSAMYIAANNTDTRSIAYASRFEAMDFRVRIKFGIPVRLTDANKLEQKNVFNLKSISYSVTMEQNGITQYYHEKGYWKAEEKKLTLSFDTTKETTEAVFEVAVGESVGTALFSIIIHKIEYAQVGYSGGGKGLYASIKEFAFCAPEGVSLLEKNKITTIYNEHNNTIIVRSPEFAPAMNRVFKSGVIKNGIFSIQGGELIPAKAWKWKDDTKNKPQQMAVYNHLQMLCYFLRPNNVLEGTIVNADVTRPACIWKWKEAEHILVGGTYDLLSGYIEGAILRQFARYEEQVYVKVAKSAAFVPKTGEILDVNIICWNMIDWQIEGLPAWITASKTSGKGEDTIQLTIAANNTGAVRVAEVIIGNAVLTITQKDRLGDFGIDFSLDYL